MERIRLNNVSRHAAYGIYPCQTGIKIGEIIKTNILVTMLIILTF